MKVKIGAKPETYTRNALLPEGYYNGSIVEASEVVRGAYDAIKLVVVVKADNGDQARVTDHVLFPVDEEGWKKVGWRTDGFLKSIGVGDNDTEMELDVNSLLFEEVVVRIKHNSFVNREGNNITANSIYTYGKPAGVETLNGKIDEI
jgi:hypothetical protein